MTNGPQQGYPQLPASVWWGLRKQFLQTVPSTVTDTYVSTVLNVEPNAARAYIRDLRMLGLLDENGSPTELAYDWRGDDKYLEVCTTIREKVYPPELIQVAPPPHPDRERVIGWFTHAARLGRGAARNKAALYALLSEADPAKQEAVPKGPRPQLGKDASTGAAPRRKTAASSERGRSRRAAPRSQAAEASQPGTVRVNPALQLTIQIHVGADASVGQIDAMFASMAKHLNIQ